MTNDTPRARLGKARDDLFLARLNALDDWDPAIERPDGTFDVITPFCEWAVKQNALKAVEDRISEAALEMLETEAPKGSA